MYNTRYIDGNIEHYKARLVAKGYLQKKGVGFNETYTPPERAKTIRLVMSQMVKESCTGRQMDVMNAVSPCSTYTQIHRYRIK